MMTRIRIAGVLLLATAVSLTGCSSGNKEYPSQVSGKVSYKGTPVTGGIITLYTATGTPFQAPISNKGTYMFPNLPEGPMTVTIETESINPDTMKKEDYKGGKAGAGGGPGAGIGAMYKKAGPAPALKKGQEYKSSPVPDGASTGEVAYVKIPAKYKDKETSGLKIDLKSGKQTKDLELND